MSLKIIHHNISLTDSYDVCDHNGRSRYSVTTEPLKIGRRIHVVDLTTREEVGYIHEKVNPVRQSRSKIYINGSPWLLRHKFPPSKVRYVVD